MSDQSVIIHTDGACSGNPGPGGWGAILTFGDNERELKGGDPHTTNNRMELMAAISALEALKRRCTIDLHTDSGGILIFFALSVTTLLWAQWNLLIELTLLSVVVLTGLGFMMITQRFCTRAVEGPEDTSNFWFKWCWPCLWSLSLASSGHEPFNYGHHGAFLQKSSRLGRRHYRAGADNSDNCWQPDAVNVTDGLDGLAIGCTLIVSFVFLVLTYLAGNSKAAEYLHIPFVSGAGELTVFCAAMIGAGLGFYLVQLPSRAGFYGRYRVPRARWRIGNYRGPNPSTANFNDCRRSVCPGSRVGHFANQLVSLYTAPIRNGPRIFLMAPIHHHFEKKGRYESQVVMRFYILGVLCAVVALGTLKIR